MSRHEQICEDRRQIVWSVASDEIYISYVCRDRQRNL
nr:MAG TPA: hypothetical protein [Caudoviricetes sp.]